MKLNKLKQTILKFSLTIIILSYFYFFIDLSPIKENFIYFNFKLFFLALLIFLPNSALYIFKWYLLISAFTKTTFEDTYKKLSAAIFFSDILQSSLFLDFSKFYYLKKIKNSFRLALLINDKLINIIVKIFYFSITYFLLAYILNFNFNFNFLLKLNQNYFSKLSFIIICVFILIIIYLIYNNKFLKKYYLRFLSGKVINRKKIFCIELIRIFLMSALYFISFYQFYDSRTALIFSIISPFIEILLRFQFVSSIGFRELIFFLIGSQFGYDTTIIIPGIFITTVTLFTSFNNFIISRFVNLKQRKTKNINFIIYRNNHNVKSAEDHFQQLKYIYNKNKKISKKNTKRIFIVENFVNPIEFIKVFFILIFFRGKKYLVNTEFATSSNNSYTFNDFGKENNMSGLKCFFNFLINDFFISRLLKLRINNNQKRINILSYYKLRYITANFLYSFFDIIILAHPKMKSLKISKLGYKTLIFPYVFPNLKIPQSKLKTKIKIIFSGYLTLFRYNFLRNLKINENLYDTSQIKKILRNKIINKFIYSSSNKKRLVFSLNIEREKKWKYSSPGTIFNNLKKNQIPIVFKKFNDEFYNFTLNQNILSYKNKKNVINSVKKLNKNINIYKTKIYKKRLNELINS